MLKFYRFVVGVLAWDRMVFKDICANAGKERKVGGGGEAAWQRWGQCVNVKDVRLIFDQS